MLSSKRRLIGFVLGAAIIFIGHPVGAQGWTDIAANGSIIALGGKKDTYTFSSFSPELRYRFRGKSDAGPFVALGSVLLTNLNQDPSKTTVTDPKPVSKTNVYIAVGWSKPIQNSDLVPVVGVGYMNQQVSKDLGTHDRGPFVYFGFSTSVFGW
jgi:hypothetical protein